MLTHIQLDIDVSSTFSLAAQQNAYPLLKTFKLEYCVPTKDDLDGVDNPEEARDQPLKPFNGLKVVLEEIPGWLAEVAWLVDSLVPHQILSLPKRDLQLPFDKLFGITEELTLALNFQVFTEDGQLITSKTLPLTILPANYWGGESRQPDLLAAFVKPNGIYVESLLKDAAAVLECAGHGRAIDGYQSNTRDKPYMMLVALWNVIVNQQLAYVSPPVGFARQGQRIRLAADISTSKIAACLDTSLLFASCIEAMGLNAVVALTRGHAFAGAWLINERLPVLTNDDPMDIRKRVDNRDMVLFETTLVTSSPPVTFEQAKEHARNLIAEEKEDDFVFVIDIAQARARQIKPLSTVEAKREEAFAKAAPILPLPVVPPLPPVRADERVQDDTPETRIDTWSRKLLDLTKRNNLLNLKDRAVAIKLFCPDIAAMEDELANGGTFKFISAQESPISDKARDAENFRMQTGSDLHREYALDQLQRCILVANQSTAKLESSAVALFRKAKNDLEEGGSNTLYLALGMLKWKENAEDDRSYRAPLILIPVILQRKSARSPVVLKQSQDDDPIFNLTLIEFLQAEHDINLSEFKGELSQDDSGIDVPAIWQRVRDVISEHRGFEVLEELVLASFSFAKYLMWRDLKDRIDDLKENPFVKHLVDHPRAAYEQDAHFVDRYSVDKEINPAEVFAPLNCDSSQLVAVEASGRAQDFVLEGPPGTGKSETIANMIAHNIGSGRKVLFVAEKMAALNVVFRRLQKVGLDHLCLELHSNKTNKRAVLDQLARAWQKQEGLTQAQWLKTIAELEQKKAELNNYVQAIHQKSVSGMSARDAIATIAVNGDKTPISLGWPIDINGGAIQSQEDFEQATQRLTMLALAYDDLKGMEVGLFKRVSAKAWSNTWQMQLVERLESFAAQAQELDELVPQWLNLFGVKPKPLSMEHLNSVICLGELIGIASSDAIDFAIEKGAKARIETMGLLAKKKRDFDALMVSLGHNITPENLTDLPIEKWLALEAESHKNWFKSLTSRWKVNAEAKKLGLSKFTDLALMKPLAQAKAQHAEILQLAEPLVRYGFWQGWATCVNRLDEAYSLGQKIRALLIKVTRLVDEPVDVLLPIKKWLVDGKDFLEESALASQYNDLLPKLQSLTQTFDALSEQGFDGAGDVTLGALSKEALGITADKSQLKRWCEWQKAKGDAAEVGVAAVATALAQGAIRSGDVIDEFRLAYCSWLAPLLIDANPILREFKASSHEKTIEHFIALDEHVAKITSDYVAALASLRAPAPASRTGPPELGVLSREIQKKTRHIPVRALIEQLGESLLSLCPCLMMSPLSVAQFLPADFSGFDVVIFDEASQMTTWDSVGAIARGKNVIVVGDPKQMPPTNFFSAAASSDDPEEEDLESILDQALAARLPLRRLMGHYRSRHETLIAFSNSKYYENSLMTYPSSDTKESAVTFRKVTGVYAKGKGRNNPIEAKAVVDEIVKRLKSRALKNQSIGVVTLNSDQQRTIEDALDTARREHPEIEPYFHSTDDYDGIFVKNLESVQGDERDVIMLSLGYGPTEPDGKTMSMNFGPLNKTGGERRLNVAITRATSEVVVFASFDSSMIDLSRTSAMAVEHLKHYLEFAERGPRALAEQSTAAYGVDQFDSDFEQAVAWALREKGWKVQTQIGVSKFRVDMGILHPEKPGVYLAGVECDGATYHGSPSARDRDRVRQGILENLGWRIVRLWSTDYFVDPQAAIEKISGALQELLDTDREAIASAPVEEATPEDLVEEAATPESIESSAGTAENNGSVPADYFADENKAFISRVAKEILLERPCITFQALALEVANAHDLKRTSPKQLAHLQTIVEPWVGFLEVEGQKRTIWAGPDEVKSEIPWRGLNAFGYTRQWSEIAYPEALGLARLALEQSPSDPVGFICDEVGLKRRYDKTLIIFQGWVDAVS